MNKVSQICLNKDGFQDSSYLILRSIGALDRQIAEIQIQRKSLLNQLKGLGFKADCDTCSERLVCVTSKQEGIK